MTISSKTRASKILNNPKETNRRRLERLLREIRAIEADNNPCRKFNDLYRRVIE